MPKRESRYPAQLTFNLTHEQKAAVEAMAASEDLAAGSWVRKTIAPFLTATPTLSPVAAATALGGPMTALPGAIVGGLVGALLSRLSSGTPGGGNVGASEGASAESALASLLRGLDGDIAQINDILATQSGDVAHKSK